MSLSTGKWQPSKVSFSADVFILATAFPSYKEQNKLVHMRKADNATNWFKSDNATLKESLVQCLASISFIF